MPFTSRLLSLCFQLFILLGTSRTITATTIQDLPSCALGCYAQAVGNTTCAVNDQYCQCTKGFQTILDIAIPCLCHSSDCRTEDLIAAQRDTNKICASALSSSSQSFAAATFGLNVCQAAATGTATGAVTIPSVSASTTKSPGDKSSDTSSVVKSSAAHTGARNSARTGLEAVSIAIVGMMMLVL